MATKHNNELGVSFTELQITNKSKENIKLTADHEHLAQQCLHASGTTLTKTSNERGDTENETKIKTGYLIHKKPIINNNKKNK